MRALVILLAMTVTASALEFESEGMTLRAGQCSCFAQDAPEAKRIEWPCRIAHDFTASKECPTAGRRILTCPANQTQSCSFILTACEKPAVRNVCWPADRPK